METADKSRRMKIKGVAGLVGKNQWLLKWVNFSFSSSAMIMRYSMKRIDRQNIVETIRNENI